MEKQVRWKQRFQNFEKSYFLLQRIIQVETLGEIENMALVQSFEICFELSWKVLKDYFYEGGRVLNSPREIIKQAVADEILENGNEWLNALQSRNMTSHVYDESIAEEIVADIEEVYNDIFKQFYVYFKQRV